MMNSNNNIKLSTMKGRKSIPRTYGELMSKSEFKNNRKNLILFNTRTADMYMFYGQHAIDVFYYGKKHGVAGELIESFDDHGFFQYQFAFEAINLKSNIRKLVEMGYKLRYIDIRPDYTK